ncbi:MAG TPA: hypothetical protein VHZ95_13855, partial [Polyangiales bacterium]|nr:hypothetical protein [Polyangiales bacterium]
MFQVGMVGMQELARGAARSVFDRGRPLHRVEDLKEQLRRQSALVASADSREDLTDELAEMLDLTFALGRARGISAKQLDARRRERHVDSADALGSIFDQLPGIERLHPNLSRRLGALSVRLVQVAKPAADGGGIVLRRAVPGAKLRIRRVRASIGKRARAWRSIAHVPT